MRITIVLAGSFVIFLSGPGFSAAVESQKELSIRLRHEYDLIKSMVCLVECVHSVTDAQTVDMIRELQKTSKYAQRYKLEQMVFSEEAAEVRSYRQKFFRQGPRERTEL